jgi:hypothetical protein
MAKTKCKNIQNILAVLARCKKRMVKTCASLSQALPDLPHLLTSRLAIIAESQPALKVSFNQPRPRSLPARVSRPL